MRDRDFTRFGCVRCTAGTIIDHFYKFAGVVFFWKCFIQAQMIYAAITFILSWGLLPIQKTRPAMPGVSPGETPKITA
jgi:hypothetical protein